MQNRERTAKTREKKWLSQLMSQRLHPVVECPSLVTERYQEELNVRFVVAENNHVVKPKCYQVTLRYLKS